ncbi:MAG TPA: Rrf2 family transcriptional regulator [Bacteroidales bacterium]|nr:Rrf2 family transcriptional regulator [Bacteroidales bacterium]HSA42792.1 Rrf2 family transcriptional regulator [Bacteroidales bacterium]
MARIVNFSEAVSIGIHSMVLIARAAESVNVLQLAASTGASRHHVAKVMQRLVKDNFLISSRGPNGGFHLKRPAQQITLLQIFESIDGAITIEKCPMDNPICPFTKCLMGNLIADVTREIIDYLERNTLADYAWEE